LFAAYGVSGETERRLATALARRDAAAAASNAQIGTLLAALLDAAGPATSAVEKLVRLDLPPSATRQITRLVETIGLIRRANPDLTLTVDPLERQGFEYQTGLSFTIFARGARRELGRGGRYRVGGGPIDGAKDEQPSGEPAVGFSLFGDAVLRAVPPDPAPRRVYIPVDARFADSERLRREGWVTVAGLAPADEPAADARRLGCDFILAAGADEPRRLDWPSRSIEG
jgi:ATP phosphoribosyltransferase regulatory subunit